MVKYIGIYEICEKLIVNYELTCTLKQGVSKLCILMKTLEGDTCEVRNMYRTWMVLKSNCFTLRLLA
jgi:hypothetical protein